jgi:hypothetical protein
MTTVLVIEFDNDFEMEFAVEPTPVADLWLRKMHLRNKWPMDDARRFYGFDSGNSERAQAESRLRECIAVINKYETIVNREFTTIDDQDLLNYLHNIFEIYHGLLDSQTSDWWNTAPATVQQALADLNTLVHRAESASRQSIPRFVCTWYGMPKLSSLTIDQMVQYGTTATEFGAVYLNYVEIGKTLEDLSVDNDEYIGELAFQPFRKYSADFVVTFGDAVPDLDRMQNYFESCQDFFIKQGIDSINHPLAHPYRYKVAKLINIGNREEIIDNIRRRQLITNIYFK